MLKWKVYINLFYFLQLFFRRSKAFRSRAAKVNKKLSELGIEIPTLELLQVREKVAKQVSPPKKSETKKQKLEQKVVEKVTITPAGKKHKLETTSEADKSVKEVKNTNKKQKIETAVPEKKQKVPEVQTPVPEKKKKVSAETLATPSEIKKKIGTPANDLKQSKVNSPASTPKVISTPLPVQKPKKPEMTTPAATPKQPEQTKTPKQSDHNKTPKQSAKTPNPESSKTPKQQSNQTPKLDAKKNKTPMPTKSPAAIKTAHLDLSVLLGGGTPKINTPKQKEVKVTKY